MTSIQALELNNNLDNQAAFGMIFSIKLSIK